MGKGNVPDMKPQKNAFIQILKNSNRTLDYKDVIKRLKEKYGYKHLPEPRKLSVWAKTIDKISYRKEKCKINGNHSKRMVYEIK